MPCHGKGQFIFSVSCVCFFLGTCDINLVTSAVGESPDRLSTDDCVYVITWYSPATGLSRNNVPITPDNQQIFKWTVFLRLTFCYTGGWINISTLLLWVTVLDVLYNKNTVLTACNLCFSAAASCLHVCCYCSLSFSHYCNLYLIRRQ